MELETFLHLICESTLVFIVSLLQSHPLSFEVIILVSKGLHLLQLKLKLLINMFSPSHFRAELLKVISDLLDVAFLLTIDRFKVSLIGGLL